MSQIVQVKDATDIVQIIGERLELQRAGSQLKANCPFHSEKSPSFFVSEVMQRYKCFGCGEHGDVFTFLEKYEGMTFAEGLKYLADRAGIVLESFKPSPQEDLRERLYAILSLSQAYYHYILTTHPAGEVAREYLKKRGVTGESVKVFQLGYSLPGWDGLTVYLHKKKGYTLSDIEAAGLATRGKNGSYYDRFRDRVMFPLTNHRGKVVGFSGRILSSSADKQPEIKEAKYINTPETELYHKSELLYGFSQLYQSIRKEKEVVVVEGELDVISSAQAHVNNVVAIKGAAFTRDHAQLLRRTVERVLLSLDRDAAGVEATKRAIEVSKEFELELRVIVIPDGKDPDELAKSNPKAWREAVDSSISVYQFLIDATLAKFDPETPEGKRHAIDELAPVLASITHAVEQDFYIKKVAKLLHVSPDILIKDIQRFSSGKKSRVSTPRKTTAENTQNEGAVGSLVLTKKKQKKSRRSRLEEYSLFLHLRMDEARVGAEHLPSWQARTVELQKLPWTSTGYTEIMAALGKLSSVGELPGLSKALAGDLYDSVSEVYLHTEFLPLFDKLQWQEEWQQTLAALTEFATSDTIDRLTAELETLDEKAERTPEDDTRQAEILKQILTLRRKK